VNILQLGLKSILPECKFNQFLLFLLKIVIFYQNKYIRGRAHHADVLKMLLNMEPPVGFGNKCPKPLAYKRLIRMNMPIDDNNTVHFNTTLFALIRVSLKIKVLNMEEADEAQMDQSDEELRVIIQKLWPFVDIKQINKCLPTKEELHGTVNKRVMTVGKVYAGLLMVENYRTYKNSLAKYGGGGDKSSNKSSFFNRLIGAVRNNSVTPRASIVGDDGGAAAAERFFIIF
jgi:hypothetical protein